MSFRTKKEQDIRMKRYPLRDRLKRFFRRKLTLMIVPHATLRPFQTQFSVSFAFFLIFFWTGLTSWATWAVMSNVDYWSMKVNHQVMKFKVQFFVEELKKSREVLGQVYEADIQLRHLLGMKARQSIIEQNPSQEGHSNDRSAPLVQNGQGGPEPFELSILVKTLNKQLWQISEDEFRSENKVILDESRKRLTSFKEISEYVAYERALFRCTPRGWPTSGRITSNFGQRVSPLHGGPQFHTGIDIANVEGTPVLATADGVVRHADWEGGYGKLIVIDHGFGFMTYYGHHSSIAVKAGQEVKRGQVIGYMGSSGSSTGDHVHYEVWLNNHYVNPWKFITARSVDDLKLSRIIPDKIFNEQN